MMQENIARNLEKLFENHVFQKNIVLWGIGNQTKDLIDWLKEHQCNIECIVDNFKYTFCKEYEQIPVFQPMELKKQSKECVVLLSVNHSDAIRRQLDAYGIKEVYNIRDLMEHSVTETSEIAYTFQNRSCGKKVLCYILAGYEEFLWENTLARIEKFSNDTIDYCIISSGIYSLQLDKLAERNNWSYLYTVENQVCYIQNLVIELHPDAEKIFKLDEDIFICQNFFESMLQCMENVEQTESYRIGFVVPVVPLNCSGYVSYLEAIGEKGKFESLFGRAYRSRFSVVFSDEKAADYLWTSVGQLDEKAMDLSKNNGYLISNCYYNIGCILYSRERWLMMGKWPQNNQRTGMGEDEQYILQDNFDKDMVIFEAQNVLAGHFAFGHQKSYMREFYVKYESIFAIHSN